MFDSLDVTTLLVATCWIFSVFLLLFYFKKKYSKLNKAHSEETAQDIQKLKQQQQQIEIEKKKLEEKTVKSGKWVRQL